MLAGRAHFVDYATAPGRLYNIDWYPGMVPPVTNVDRVIGEVFAFTDESLLQVLDRFEETSPGNDENGEFRRVRHLVNVRHSKPWKSPERETWAYLYNGPIQEENRIQSGDFILHKRKH